MALRYAVATGNWSNVAIWDGGAALPGVGDTVHSNGFTITIDQDIDVSRLTFATGGGAVTNGGGFVHSAGTHALDVDYLEVGGFGAVSGLNLLTLSGGSATITCVGAVAGDVSSSGLEPYALAVTNGSHVLNADVLGGTTISNASAVVVSGVNASLVVYGTVRGSAAPGIEVGSSGQLTVVGRVEGGAGISGIVNTGGIVRLDAVLAYVVGRYPPLGGLGSWMFDRTGEALGMEAPSDDNWPAATGEAILVERYTTGNPLPADVREGVLYGPGATSTGTLAVPDPSSVAGGVPTDDTVGTGVLDRDDLIADLTTVIGAIVRQASSR